jgi:ectoine hydroxylase
MSTSFTPQSAPSERMEREPPPRATLGCIQLPTDLTLDQEGPALVSRFAGVRVRFQKIVLEGDALDLENYGTGRGAIQAAASTLRPTGSMNVIGLACTSLAFALGREAVQAELRAAQPDAETTDMASAALAAMDQIGARRPAVLTPYIDELHESNLELFEADGRRVVSHRNLGLRTDTEITALSPRSVAEAAAQVDVAEADVVFIGCSAFRVCTPGFLDALEERLGKPVLSSQQVFLWHMLRLAGIQDRIGGYGSLFAGRHEAQAAIEAPPPEVGRSGPTDIDLYPSRVDEPGLVRRVDPVVDEKARLAGPLSPGEIDNFDRRGFLLLGGVFSPGEVRTLRGSIEELRAHYESQTYEQLDRSTDMRVITERGGSLVTDGGGTPVLKSIWQIHLPPEHAPHMLFSAELARRVVCDARLVGRARQLLGEEVYVHQSRINYQRGWSEQSLGGSGFLWHQDFEQWHSEDGMPRMRAVSMAVLLEPAMPANGALMVMPGTHRALIQARTERDADRYTQGALSRGPTLPARFLHEAANEHGITYCRGEAGDVVLFDCNLVHGSHTNISPWGRAMLFVVYNAISNTPARRAFAMDTPRPEHIGSRDPRWAGVPLPMLHQSLEEPLTSADDRLR